MTSEKVKQDLEQLNDRMFRAEQNLQSIVADIQFIKDNTDIFDNQKAQVTESSTPEVDDEGE